MFGAPPSTVKRRGWTSADIGSKIESEVAVMKPRVTPFVVAARILAVIGMGLTAAMAILLVLIPAWAWAALSVAAFLPFFGLIVLVERYSVRHGMIGPETPSSNE